MSRRGTRATLALVLATALATGLLAGTTPASAGPSSLDGPGSYIVVRTYPQTAGPTPVQNAACDEYFGSRAATVALRQNAVQFVPRVQRSSGLAVDESAAYAGPGYICAAPALNQDLSEAFAIADVPAGRATMHGPCQLSLAEALRLAPFLGCRLTVDPIPGVTVGGHAVSNTVAGSIFVGYLVRDPAKPLPHTPPSSEPSWRTLPNDPDFYIWRSFDSTSTSCGSTASLSATQPNLQNTTLDGDEPLTKVGSVALCFVSATGVLATAEIRRGGVTVRVTAQGDCRTVDTRAGAGLLVQTCVLSVLWADSPLFRAGQLTSIGLVRRDNPRVAANSHVWTLGILDAQTGAP